VRETAQNPQATTAGSGAFVKRHAHDTTMDSQLAPEQVLELDATPEVGDSVVAQDGAFGTVEHIVSDGYRPAFLVVSVGRRFRRRHPVIPWALVRAVDRRRRHTYVRGRGRSLGRLSESLPILL
jgi:hypothetical protein